MRVRRPDEKDITAVPAQVTSTRGGHTKRLQRSIGNLGLQDALTATETDVEEEDEEELEDVDSVEMREPDDKKPRPAKRRKRVRRGNFAGQKLFPKLGIVTGKYFHHRIWPWDRRKAKTQPKESWRTVTTKKQVTVETSDSDEERLKLDTTMGHRGNAGFDGKVTGTAQRSDEVYLFADPPPPKVPAGGVLLDEIPSTRVQGTLTFSFGDLSDRKNRGGKGRIQITRTDAAGGSVSVYDSSWLTTLGKPRTVALTGLAGNAVYTVTISVETWWAGYTEYACDLQLTQHSKLVSRFEVTTTKKVKE
ncbi:MAG TPA: hypothetical protein VF111_14925 [Thermoanaerobaculia bacterium]